MLQWPWAAHLVFHIAPKKKREVIKSGEPKGHAAGPSLPTHILGKFTFNHGKLWEKLRNSPSGWRITLLLLLLVGLSYGIACFSSISKNTFILMTFWWKKNRPMAFSHATEHHTLSLWLFWSCTKCCLGDPLLKRHSYAYWHVQRCDIFLH
jgi:hypothetical protein